MMRVMIVLGCVAGAIVASVVLALGLDLVDRFFAQRRHRRHWDAVCKRLNRRHPGDGGWEDE